MHCVFSFHKAEPSSAAARLSAILAPSTKAPGPSTERRVKAYKGSVAALMSVKPQPLHIRIKREAAAAASESSSSRPPMEPALKQPKQEQPLAQASSSSVKAESMSPFESVASSDPGTSNYDPFGGAGMASPVPPDPVTDYEYSACKVEKPDPSKYSQ